MGKSSLGTLFPNELELDIYRSNFTEAAKMLGRNGLYYPVSKVTVINTDGNDHPVNCILALSKDVNDLYEISKTAIFVPEEVCRPGKSISVDFDVEVHDEFDDDFEDEEGGEDANDAESAAATESDN